jgi:hypothetical protein
MVSSPDDHNAERLITSPASPVGNSCRHVFPFEDPSRWPRGTLYLQKLALTSPTSGGRLVGIVRSRTQATEFSLVYVFPFVSRAECWTQVIDFLNAVHHRFSFQSRDSYRLVSPGSIAGVETFLFHSVQTHSGPHPASSPLGAGGHFHGGKAAGAWSWPLTFT